MSFIVRSSHRREMTAVSDCGKRPLEMFGDPLEVSVWNNRKHMTKTTNQRTEMLTWNPEYIRNTSIDCEHKYIHSITCRYSTLSLCYQFEQILTVDDEVKQARRKKKLLIRASERCELNHPNFVHFLTSVYHQSP
jgi:hypothetical protein